MSDLIKREDVIKLIQARYECPEICAREINHIPTVDASPVIHAHWKQYSSIYEPECSNCDGSAPCDERGNDILSRYCPHCGAIMDK